MSKTYNHLPRDLRWICKHDSFSVDGCVHCEAADAIEALQRDIASRQSCEVDARRYRRLRVIGAAPAGSDVLNSGTVLRFQSLDEVVDTDLLRYPSRGEATQSQPQPLGGEQL